MFSLKEILSEDCIASGIFFCGELYLSVVLLRCKFKVFFNWPARVWLSDFCMDAGRVSLRVEAFHTSGFLDGKRTDWLS